MGFQWVVVNRQSLTFMLVLDFGGTKLKFMHHVFLVYNSNKLKKGQIKVLGEWKRHIEITKEERKLY